MQQYLENYTVQENGDVISHYTGEPLKVITYKKNKQGKSVIYPRVSLKYKGKTKKFALHRLIAMVFIPNPYNLPHVNHKDGNRLNNHVDNLEWCTHEENIKHAMENGLNPKGERQGIAVATEEIVAEIRRLRRETSLTYPEIAKMFSLKESTVGAIGRYQNWFHIK